MVLSLGVGIKNEKAVLCQKHLRIPAAMPVQRVGHQGQHNISIGSFPPARKQAQPLHVAAVPVHW